MSGLGEDMTTTPVGVPMNRSLALMCNLEYFLSENRSNSAMPCILHLDSMSGSHNSSTIHRNLVG